MYLAKNDLHVNLEIRPVATNAARWLPCLRLVSYKRLHEAALHEIEAVYSVSEKNQGDIEIRRQRTSLKRVPRFSHPIC